MVETYEIRIVNGKERLFIYLNFDYEFASINNKSKKKDLTKLIKEYIEKNKIIYKGTLVSIICGGMLLGTVNLTKMDNTLNNDYLKEQEIVLEEKQEESKQEEIIEIKEEQIEDTKQEIKEEKKEVNTQKKEKKQVIEEKPKEEIKETLEEKPKEELKIIEGKQEVEDNKTYVNVKRSSGTITLELEEYIIGVVGSEMPASFHIEALKAQAVVARTYALNAISKGKTLTDNSSTQQYKNNNELKEMWKGSFDTYYKKIKNAVDSTKGEYLTYNGKYIDAVYHSTSNGKTEDAKNVWGNSIPYLVSVESSYDNLNPSYEKTIEVSYTDFSDKLKLEFNSDTVIKLNGITEGNRVSYIQIGEKVLTGVEFRNLLGLRSADFDIEKKEGSLLITTYGYGHGVGMSQYGANGMAKNGSNYQQILFHYYNGVKLTK